MQMREFLRGGYKDIKELTLITNHSRPVATWNPYPYKKKKRDIHISEDDSHDAGVQVQDRDVDSEEPTP
jgi:hypothetical protein